ncbi:hypothetical protein MIR68_001661 [Amoeboaphelidium protococcarum]|nr:hypothetical protein MIR68_001661 [Amoeboaphelidium protococcarum]KAI3643033.1 hypothetical protein MP228_012588 [Amoeboaphelidium protococcarum]KAI3653273.1 hypothetical protein MP228_001220 [Amoeboaphelidium protococcarum]
MATPFIAGLGIAAAAFGTRAALRAYKQHGHKLSGVASQINQGINSTFGASGYARGGFEAKMNKREAAQILGLREAGLTRDKIKEAHRRIMLLNHPDRGGSPFMASKINEAKDLLEKTVRR